MLESNKVIELIQAFESFSQESPGQDLQDFGYWLVSRNQKAVPDERQLNRDLGYLLNRINRFARHYAKMAFADMPINSIDEFSFLTIINAMGSPSKSAVYDVAIVELTTGQQMMRRLVQLGLIQEFNDPKDKRVKRVKLTATGKQVQQKAFEQIGYECDFKFANLDLESKLSLKHVLTYLNNYHSKILPANFHKSFQELIHQSPK